MSLEPAVECDWYTQCHFIDENWFFLSQQVSITDCFLVRGRTWCPLLLSAQILSSWNLYRSFVCCHGLWVHMYISLLSLEGLLSLELSIISSSYCFPASTWAKISEGRSLIKTSHLGSGPKILIPTLPPRGSLNYYLLSEHVSCGALVCCYSSTPLGIILFLCSLSRMTEVGFLLGPMIYLVSGLWPLLQYQVWVPY